MRLGYAEQYKKSCVIIEEGNTLEEIIDFAEEKNALFYEGPDPIEDKCYVVQFPWRPKELYSEVGLRGSFKNKNQITTHTT